MRRTYAVRPCLFFVPLMILTISSAALAQQTAFTYQGRLTDGGAPANGLYNMQFRIFDIGTVGMGTQIGPTLTPPPVQVSAGSFSVQLDFGSGVFTGPARYLDIVVNGTPLNPRQQITSTPYAIRSLTTDNADTATNATQLGGVDAARFVQSDAGGNVSIAGNLTVTGIASYDTVNANTQFNLGGQRVLSNAGTQNLFIGIGAGSSNTTGINNAFVGYFTGNKNTGGSSNSFFGSGAGFFNTSGTANSFFGFDAGAGNTAGANNSFFGSIAGNSNTTGQENSYFGAEAGVANQTGVNNAFFGRRAGFANTTGSNSFFGAFSGTNTTVGDSNSFFGAQSGQNNTTGFSNTFVGAFAGISNSTGNTNSFFGRDAGVSNTTGSLNSFFGRSAGFQNTTGSNNSFFGVNAGGNNIVGTYNAFFGDSSGISNTTGSTNSFFGQAAGFHNTTGSDNTFVGNNAGQSNTTGGLNSFFGQAAGISNVDGAHNSFFGVNAGLGNLSGIFNSFFGKNAGYSNTADFNAFFGAGAGELNTTGTNNSFFGTSSGGANVTGSLNSFFGREAGRNNTAEANSFFGYQAGFSNTTGGANSFFGQGTGQSNTTGAANAFFGEAAGQNNTSASNNSFFGGGAGGNNTTGGNNSSFGRAAGLANTTGSNITLLGASADVGANNLTNATAIGAGAIVSASNSVVLGSNANVGIGVSAPPSKLTVAGIVETTTGGVKFPDGTIQTSATAGAGPVVTSLNGLTNGVTLAAGANITITPSGNTLTIDSTGGGGGAPILNQTTLQTGANFNIDGTGTAGILNARTRFNYNGQGILSAPGQDNLFAGIGAGNTPGPDFFENTFVGRNSGANTQFCCNAFFGGYSGESNTQGDNNTYLGYLAGQNSTTGQQNVYVGQSSGQGTSITSASFNTFVGYKTGAHNANGGNNTYIGWKADSTVGNLSFASAIGAGATVSASDTIVIGKPAGTYNGVSHPADTIIIPGNLTVNGTFSNPSDARLKTGITNLRYGLNEVLRLRPVTWTWKNDSNGKTQLGLVAQEIKAVLPELVLEGSDEDRLLSLNYLGLMPIIIKAIQEQQATIVSLRNELDSQTKSNADVKVASRSLAEAPGTLNIFSGNVTTNVHGEAIVTLPEYIEALNRDFRYQLTVIGRFAQAIVASEIKNNRFTIKTNRSNVKVSWQVTSIRPIAYANAN